jgi:hypothetical protein
MKSTLATAGASSGSAALLSVVIVWLLSLWHIKIPEDVALALSSLLMTPIHYIFTKQWEKPDDPA